MANADQIQQAKARLGIVGTAPSLLKAVGRAIRVAPIDISVLVTGESGSGKEFFPQLIHAWSPRKHSRYIAVNCGAIPEGTIDSELFGHEKGAFTGAISSRKGYFEEADGGTIFLDEVAELPLTTQARLLRVLESGEFIKVGSSVVQKTNLRVVAATNVDMEKAVKEGRFREDLFYRLSTVQITVPPLRDRGSDIMLLARKFANDFAERYRMPAVTFGDDARDALLHYRWPGNVRQLKNVVEQIALFEGGNNVDRDTLLYYLPQAATTYAPVKHQEAPAPHSYEHEREMLFSLIMRMQNEISELKEQIAGERRVDTPAAHSSVAVTSHKDSGASRYPICVNPVHPQPQHIYDPLAPSRQNPPHEVEDTEPVDVPFHTVERWEGRTLEETERETIRLALERNEGRRKATAAELNISERTLYRKIKEFGLE